MPARSAKHPYIKPGALVAFSASSFTATEFTPADQKAKFANDLVIFILKDCPQRLFTKAMYRHLSGCFGHIAHYDQSGFFATWFSNDQDKMRFCRNMIEFSKVRLCRGSDPRFTFCDVEMRLGEWAERHKLDEFFARRVARRTERAQRVEFNRLKAIYEPGTGA